MKRIPLLFLAVILLLGLGYGAYTLGRLASKPELGGTVLQNPVDVRGVSLTGAAGKPVAFDDFQNQLTLVFFGYTRCPDVCPVTLARLAKMYRDLGEPSDLQVVMVTVDPGNDTPELTQRYATSFHPDFVGLGGSNAQVATAARTFFVGYGAGDKPVAHTDAVLLVDPEGHLRAVYGQDNLEALPRDMAAMGIRTRSPGG